MSRLAKSFALFLSFAGLLLGATNANAVPCTSVATGNWSAQTTWGAAGTGCAGAVGGIPGAADTVTIAAAHVVTLTANAAATSISITAPTGATKGVTLAGFTLNVSGAITMTAPGTNLRTSTLAVGSGTLTAASITINGGTGTKVSQVTVSTGTITTTGSITLAGTAANARLISTGASMINIGGNLTSGGTLTTTNTGTINFNGTVAAQSMGAYLTYNNVTIANTNVAGVVTLLGNTSVTGALTVTSGTLAKNTRTLGVAGNLVVNDAITGTTGDITLSGAAATIDGTGSITTTTGLLSITAAKSILATANLTIASPIAVTGAITVTNNGTITNTSATGITGSVPGSTWVNAANSTLNVSGPLLAIGTLTASANPNTVNYAGAAQTVKATAYHHLSLGGSLAKTMTGVTTVGGNLTLSGTATAITEAAFAVGGNLDVGVGTTFTSANFTNSVTGTTTVSGTLAHSGVAAKTYSGAVTINAGGSLTNAGNAPITYAGGLVNTGSFASGTGAQTFTNGGITHNGTAFTAGTGAFTFNTNPQAIDCATALSIPSITTAIALTNNCNLTVATDLSGAGSFINAATGTLSYGGALAPMAAGTLTATASGNVVTYTGAAQPIKATAYDTLNVTGTATNSGTVTAAAALGGVGTLTNAATGILNIGGTSLITGLTAIAGGNIVNYTGAGQTIKATAYDTLNVTGTATNSGTVTATAALGGAGTLTNTGTLNIGGTSAITTLTATAGGNIVNYTGAGQTIKATAYDTLNVTGTATNSGTVTAAAALGGAGTLTNTGTLNIGGTSLITGLTATAGGNIVNYTGAGQTIKATAYDTLNVTGTATNSGTVTAAAALGGVGTLTNAAAGVLNIGGAATIAGLTATAVGNTVNYTGTGQTIKGTTYHHLTPGGGAGSLGADTTVNGTLALGANTLATGTNTLTMTSNCSLNAGDGSITHSSGFVIGKLRLTFPTGISTCTFHVGSGTTWAPIGVAMVSTAAGTLTGRTTAGPHPQLATSAIDPTKIANRYWTLGATGDTLTTSNVTSYGATFNFVAGDLIGGAIATNFIVGKYTSSTWSLPTPVTVQTATATGVSGIPGSSDFGDFAVGEQDIANCTSIASGNWNVPATWTTCRGGIPLALDTVTIDNTHAVALNIDSPVIASLTVNNGGSLTNAANKILSLGGNLTNNGTLSMGTGGSVTLTANSQWTGSATSTWNLYQINLGTKSLTFGATDSFTLSLAAASPILNMGSLNTTGINSTLTFQFGGAAQALPVSNVIYPNVVLAGSGTKTLSGAGIFDVRGNFTLNSGPTFAAGASNVDLYGNFSNNGDANFNPGSADSGTWTFKGTVMQNVNSTGILTTFPNLALNNSFGIALNASATVNTLLTLTNGYISTGTNILISSANCTDISATNGTSWVRTNGFVAGNLRLTFPIGATTCTYPVGSGSVYAPINLTTPLLSLGGKMTGSTTGNEHPNVASSPVDSSKDVNRFWTLSGDTINAGSYVTTFNFVTGDVDIGAQPLGFVLGRYASSAWTTPASPTPSALAITASLTGPIVGATDFVAGEAGFVCSGPVGMTCVCDNFNRVSLNPSTMFPGANWNVSTSSGTFGLPRIVNNRLRLTDSTNDVSTAATAPGTYPAKGNWITVEFKHYAYSGTGADGIAFTLSDALTPAAPGAFGGSLGYAQKTGINGFAGGWVGIAIDEFGNFSNNTEGRTGGAAPGPTIDSVAVRGSGSGQIGYPYLGGTATLAPPVDAPAPAVAGLGHAYRLTVDARGYTWDGATGTKSTLVSIERDTTGTGTGYTPLVPAFDAYVVNPSQADVPTDWQLSFTGSTGGSTNIHEIIGLKICAQTIVPPAGYRIQVDNMTPTTCPSDPQPTVTISALNANGQVITNYTNTVTLAATLASGGGGGASSATWIPYPSNTTGWDAINKRYTFVAGDNGVAKFYLSDLVQQNVYITVSEYLGTLNSSLAAPVYFSSGVASFVVSTPAPDTLGDGVVAGRPHLMRITRNKAVCGGGTDTTGYEGARALDGWYNPATGEHPTGANAPQICAPAAGGGCLPAYGSCQTLSIAPPVVASGSNNLSLTFLNGVADFCLITSDVGKYSLGLRDDSVATGTPVVTGASTNLTARPFAVVVSGLTGNPGGTDYNGTVFTSAGTQFPATVGGYLWTSNGTTNQGRGDTGGDGVPDALATSTELTASGLAPHYADTVTLAAGAPYTPAVPTGIAGALSNGGVSVTTGGTATVSTLSYNEVGSFTLTAAPATSYLNSGINLINRVAIFSIPSSSSQDTWVGRFKPHYFELSAGAIVDRSDMGGGAGCTPDSTFTYMDEPMKASFTLTARNADDNATSNYAGSYAKFTNTALSWTTYGSDDSIGLWMVGSNYSQPGSTNCKVLFDSATPFSTTFASCTGATPSPVTRTAGPRVAVTSPAALSWSSGAATFSATTVLKRADAPDGPYDTLDIGVAPRDSEGVTLQSAVFDLDVDNSGSSERKSLGTTKARFGRLRLLNAYGSELLKPRVEYRAEYWDGSRWATNAADTCTSLANVNVYRSNPNPVGLSLPAVNAITPFASGPGGVGFITFETSAAGSFDIALNLNASGNDTSCNAGHGGTAASMPWLQGFWAAPGNCNNVAAWQQDPNARIKLGSPKAPYIYIRERY